MRKPRSRLHTSAFPARPSRLHSRSAISLRSGRGRQLNARGSTLLAPSGHRAPTRKAGPQICEPTRARPHKKIKSLSMRTAPMSAMMAERAAPSPYLRPSGSQKCPQERDRQESRRHMSCNSHSLCAQSSRSVKGSITNNRVSCGESGSTAPTIDTQIYRAGHRSAHPSVPGLAHVFVEGRAPKCSPRPVWLSARSQIRAGHRSAHPFVPGPWHRSQSKPHLPRARRHDL